MQLCATYCYVYCMRFAEVARSSGEILNIKKPNFLYNHINCHMLHMVHHPSVALSWNITWQTIGMILLDFRYRYSHELGCLFVSWSMSVSISLAEDEHKQWINIASRMNYAGRSRIHNNYYICIFILLRNSSSSYRQTLKLSTETRNTMPHLCHK